MPIVTLRALTPDDREVLVACNQAASLEEAERLIGEWSKQCFAEKPFEMLLVTVGDDAVGMISLWERSRQIVSIGPEIFPPFRRRGYGKAAFAACMTLARERGYGLVVQQIRTNNEASLRLHESLGFETDGNILRNRHDNPVFIYIKML